MTTQAQTKSPPAQTTLPPPTRMRIDKIRRGKIQTPLRVTLYGPEGVGKSTFGAGAPSPIFLGAEEGTQQLDVARFPKPENFAEVFEAIRTLTSDPHEFQTLVVDTLDWLEPLVWKHLCAKDGVEYIEEYQKGYGKGYTAAVDEWRRLLAALERLQVARGMHVVLLAHSHIKSFKNPAGEDYDRYQLKLNEKAAGVIKEWCDAVLFTNHETYARKDERTKRVRGVSTDARLIYTQRKAAFDAKNRYGLPEELPLSWPDFSAAVQAGQVADPAVLREEIARKAKELGPELEKLTIGALEKAGNDPNHLALLNNRVNAKLSEKTAAESANKEQ